MREINMVEIYELERKIQDEKTKEIWASIDEEFLDECEKHRQWYLDFTKKEHHPMSYQVKKEIEEWEEKEPLFNVFEEMQTTWLYICLGYMCASLSIGFVIVAFLFS